MAEKKVNTTNEDEKKKKKKLFIIFGSILGAGAIAGASVGIYFAVKPKAQPVKVDVPTIDGLTFKNRNAYIGQDYSTEISIDIAKTGENRLPDELKSVKSGNRTITDTEYTYDVADNKETADFKIPGKYVEGDIKIDLELVPPGPVLDPLLTIEYEYQDGTIAGENTVGFVYYDNNPGTVTFDWGDGSPIDEVTAYTDDEEALTNPITHTYSSAPTEGQIYTITISGELSGLLASALDEEYIQVVIKPGNFYFKSATLHKNLNKFDDGDGEATPYCTLGGAYDGGTRWDDYSNISQINFGEHVTEIPDSLMAYSHLQTLTIPNHITDIYEEAFSRNEFLESVIFEDNSSLKNIGKEAFSSNDSLRTIDIPHTVKSIGDYAFEGDNVTSNVNLKDFDENDELPTLGSRCFSPPDYGCFVTSSEAMANKFKAAPGWSNYSDHIFYGANVFYIDPIGDYPNFTPAGPLDSIVMTSTNSPSFYIEEDGGSDYPSLTDLKITDNLGRTLAATHNFDTFVIDCSYYQDDLVWIKVVYQPQ